MIDELDPVEQRERFADRLREAGVSTRRFIDVHNGAKGSTNHTQLEPDDPRLQGNYGVYGGRGADREDDPAALWLVDVDVDDYADDGATTDGLDSLPPTFTIESPHTDGETAGHPYYAVRGNVAEAFDDSLSVKNPSPPWGEVRVKNQYVVGPGSQISPGGCTHGWCDDCKGCDKDWCDECAEPNGGYYRIAEDRPIAVLDLEKFVAAIETDMPDDTTANVDVDVDPDDYEPDPDAAVEDVLESKPWIGTYLALGPETAIEKDDRSVADWRACKDLIKGGVGEDDARDLLAGSPHSKVGAADASANYWANTWSNAVKAVAKDQPTAAADGGTVTVDASAPDAQGGSDSIDGWNDVRALFDSTDNNSTTRGYARAAELLYRDHAFVTIRETDELYYYNPDLGYYVRKGESFIAELLEEYIPGYVNSGRRRNIHETVRARNYIDADDFTPPEGKVCVENGVLDLDTRELEPHSPDYYFTSCLRTPRVEEGEAPQWEQFLAESTSSEEARKLEEFIGYCLEVWHHKRHKNMFIVGPRQSGKSTFVDTVQALFGGMPTVSNLTPQQIADTRFGAANLKEAALNSVNDINARKIEDTGTLKRAFAGEPMKFERKRQDEEFGAPNAKHLYSANWLPALVGQDESFYRRVLLVEFPNQLDDDERDLELEDKLAAELPGILNRALDARDRLHEQGHFTNDRDDTATRHMWDSWRDGHKRFLYTQFRITGDSSDSVGKETYYRAYKEYAGRNGHQLKPKQGVTKSLQWVPEIDVSDDSYAGIVWRDSDAGDPTEAQQIGLGVDFGETPQNELVVRVMTWVDQFATPTRPADREELVSYAADQGEDPGRVGNFIDNLCEKGELYTPTEGGLRQT